LQFIIQALYLITQIPDGLVRLLPDVSQLLMHPVSLLRVFKELQKELLGFKPSC
jgi:hypothetical protein